MIQKHMDYISFHIDVDSNIKKENALETCVWGFIPSHVFVL